MEKKQGTLENLSPEENDIKEQIRNWLRNDLKNYDPKWSDWMILRFCRARKFDVPKIKLMIQKYLDWCAQNNVD